MNTTQLKIVEELTKHAESLKRNYFAIPMSTFDIETRTLGSNTVRAYKKGKCYNKYTPSSLFKHWLHYFFFGNPETVRLLTTGDDFFAIHSQAVQNLNAFWNEKEPGTKGMEFYHFTKLIDLLFKCIPRWIELEQRRQEWFFEHVHVPIDKYTLLLLREIRPEYDIPSPSMNYVGDDKELYYKIQKDIREMIAPFPPLFFDLYAWDYRRQEQETFELKEA